MYVIVHIISKTLIIFFRNAAIWSLSEEKRSNVHKWATKHQKKFIYLPLHVFREATNIYQLLREKNHGNINKVDTLARQIHIDLINISSWPIFLSGLKFLNDETIQSVGKSGRSGSIKSNSSVQSDRLSRKRKVIVIESINFLENSLKWHFGHFRKVQVNKANALCQVRKTKWNRKISL